MQNLLVDEMVTQIVGMDEIINHFWVAMYSNTPKALTTYWGGHPKLLLETLGNHHKNEDGLLCDCYQEKDAWSWIN